MCTIYVTISYGGERVMPIKEVKPGKYRLDYGLVNGARKVKLFSGTKADAERVNNLNNPAAKMQKRARTQQIYSSEEGGVHYQQFRDVKMNLAEQLHDMQKNK